MPHSRGEFECEVDNSHAILDQHSRKNKAAKLLALVTQLHGRRNFTRMLEVGTGSGFIAAYCAKATGAQTWAVDVQDELQITSGFQFVQVKGTRLPFLSSHFDFVISNHVIEHVGELQAQQNHLTEVYRCLEPNGILYFAVPNRWRFVEPHYKLPFLSWFPQRWASVYLRVTGKGGHYDCRPLSRSQAGQLLKEAGFEVQEAILDAISLVGKIEGGHVLRGITRLPRWVWWPLLPVMPTLIFVCRKPDLATS